MLRPPTRKPLSVQRSKVLNRTLVRRKPTSQRQMQPPKKPTPRQKTYLRLRATCKRLEGSCRQMAHERGDDFTWLQAAHHYNKVSEAAQQLRKKGEWLRFGKLAEVFDASLPKVERLATIANGVTSLSTSPLLVLPPFLRPKVTAGGIIIP